MPSLKELYNWYYCPEETLKSIGFYINPYKQWAENQRRHIFAFDACCNLYVGQYSVYDHHMDKICDLTDKREFGMLYPKNSGQRPKYREDELALDDLYSVVEFKFLESKNIIYLNRRLKKMAQRFYDYGMPEDTILTSKEVDLWNPNIASILKKTYWEKPDRQWLEANL
jgi:hypothetical protein